MAGNPSQSMRIEICLSILGLAHYPADDFHNQMAQPSNPFGNPGICAKRTRIFIVKIS
jgi:hypothetical protein